MSAAAPAVLLSIAIAAVVDARGLKDISPQVSLSADAAEALPPCDRCYDGHNSQFPWLQWHDAAREEGLDLNNVSVFARCVFKTPRSMVERLQQLYHEKVRGYNFMGAISPPQQAGRRSWVLPWAEEHFGKDDMLKIRVNGDKGRAVPELLSWERLGPFDYTDMDTSSFGNDSGLTIAAGLYPPPEYFQVMASSNYTLCPGGDAAFSWRSLESIAAGALPLIKDPKQDWFIADELHWGHALQAVLDKMHYVLLEDLPTAEYRWDWVEENWNTFIKYLTFMEGDNEIPGLTPCLCHNDAINPKTWIGLQAP